MATKWLFWLALQVLGLGAASAQATIERLALFDSQNPGILWMTEPFTTEWILGVSDAPAGPLLNAPDSSVGGLAPGDYWLFLDPAALGRYPVLTVRLSDGTQLTALFRIVGSNGSEQAWQRLAGSPLLSLGWAAGTADLVGTTNGTAPDGIADFYLFATLGVPAAAASAVPEPAPAALLLAGLAALAAMLGACQRSLPRCLPKSTTSPTRWSSTS